MLELSSNGIATIPGRQTANIEERHPLRPVATGSMFNFDKVG